MAEPRYTLEEYPGKFHKASPLDLKGSRYTGRPRSLGRILNFRIHNEEDFKKIMEKIPESLKAKFSYEVIFVLNCVKLLMSLLRVNSFGLKKRPWLERRSVNTERRRIEKISNPWVRRN